MGNYLRKTMKKKMILPCIRGTIGKWVYYSSALNAEQITEWVEPSKDIKVAKSLDEYLQRTLKAREKEISKYIIRNDYHFFNSILIGVYGGVPDWIEFNVERKIEELGGNPELLVETVGLLVFSGEERMFAIDGQHRVQGINKAFNEVKKQQKGIGLLSEKFPVIFLAHIDDEKGRRRTRRLFSDINKKAKTIPTKDTIIIDEEDICAIVTRKIYGKSPYFKLGSLIDIESDSRSLDRNDFAHFTNLTNLYTVIKRLKPLYKKEKDTNDWEIENVQKLDTIVEEFLDFIFKNKAEYNDFFIKKSLSLKEAREDNKYLLFRPIGFTLIARLYAHFHKHQKLKKLKKHINTLSFILPKSPFNKILWDNGKMEANIKNQTLAFNLSLYLLQEENKRKTHDDLLNDYRRILKDDQIHLPKTLI